MANTKHSRTVRTRLRTSDANNFNVGPINVDAHSRRRQNLVNSCMCVLCVSVHYVRDSRDDDDNYND